MKFFLSYPRSGNHLIRFITEYITAGYTQGCINNKKDLPLYTNEYSEVNILSHVDRHRQVLLKVHSIAEANFNATAYLTGIERCMIVLRNPLFCISSHLRNDAELDSKEFEVKLKNNLDHYNSIYEVSFKNTETTTIWYEELLGESVSDSLSAISEFFRDDLVLKRYTELCLNPKLYFDISSGGKGRSWGGSQSLKDKYHYISIMSKENRFIFLNVIRSYLDSKLEETETLKSKYHLLNDSRYGKNINNYLEELDEIEKHYRSNKFINPFSKS
ncbi:hypothetical protein AB4347_16910 [Vibrio breoganii]